jgi:hypothetical protein
MRCLTALRFGRLQAAVLGLLLLGCRAPLRLPDRTLPRAVSFTFAPGVEDVPGLQADLEAAFQPQWQVMPDPPPAREGSPVLRVHVLRQVLGSHPHRGVGLLLSGGAILGVGALVMRGASGWDTLAWIPIGGASLPLILTGAAQLARSHTLDLQRGYPMPVFTLTLRLEGTRGPDPGVDHVDQWDLRAFARPLDPARARDPREVRKACVAALVRYVAVESGLEE